MKEPSGDESPKPQTPGHARPRNSWADRALLLGTAIGVIAVLCLVVALFARVVLQSPKLNGIPADALSLMTFLAILTTMVLCFLAFSRGRRAASRQAKSAAPASSPAPTPYPEHGVVRTLVAKADQHGRPVKAGTVGTIVHVYPTERYQAPAYTVEVVLEDGKGMQRDAHLFDARHEELELCPSKDRA